MTIKRLDHVSVVVDDLAAAIAFFTALGMTVEGEMPVEGPWVDRVNGLESVQVARLTVRADNLVVCRRFGDPVECGGTRSAVVLRSATPSLLHQRHIGRVLRSS
jgi:catechol 2,3-dioxygenase-like lactoylglutathione lyase family enzyme